MAIVRTGAVSESGIVFFSSGGHNHDGINSSIIDSTKYSMFDFGFGIVGSNQDRIQRQIINQNGFKNFIIQTVNDSVLEPAGIVLQDDTINSRNIIAGSITAIEIATNTITANNIAANTITGNEIAAQTITANNIATGTITSAQIAANTITANNIAAGTITADKLSVGAITAGAVTITNGDYWNSNGTFRLGGLAGINWNGTTDITFGSNVSITGSITSTGTISGGIISGVQLTGSTGEIGGWDILGTRLSGGGTSLYSNGTIQCDILRTGSSGGRIELGQNIGSGDEIYLYSTSTNKATIRNPSGSKVRMSTTGDVSDADTFGFYTSGNLEAGGDVLSRNSGSCGTSGDRFSEVFATNGTINTSDQRLKTDIVDVPVGLDFIKELRPVSYKWIVGDIILDPEERSQAAKEFRDPVIIEKPGVRDHYGLIAQEVKEVIDKFNITNFAGWKLADKDNPESTQMLVYTEFIPPMIKAIQELSARVEALEAELGYNN